MIITFEGTSTTAWTEAIGSAVAALLAILSLVISIRTDRKTKRASSFIRLETQFQNLVAGIANVDKSHLSSPTHTRDEKIAIVAAKSDEYEALYTVYKNVFSESERSELDRKLGSIKTLEDQALAARNGPPQTFNQLREAYFDALITFVNSLKAESDRRLAEVSRQLDE